MKTKPILKSYVASLILIGAALIVLAILAFNSKDDVFGRVRYVPGLDSKEKAYYDNCFLYA